MVRIPKMVPGSEGCCKFSSLVYGKNHLKKSEKNPVKQLESQPPQLETLKRDTHVFSPSLRGGLEPIKIICDSS